MSFKPEARNQAWNFINSSILSARFIKISVNIKTKKPLNVVYYHEYINRKGRTTLKGKRQKSGSEGGLKCVSILCSSLKFSSSSLRLVLNFGHNISKHFAQA